MVCMLIPPLAQVPVAVFLTDKLPKTATGKIQRRMMVEHFVTKGGKVARAPTAGPAGSGARERAPTAGAQSSTHLRARL